MQPSSMILSVVVAVLAAVYTASGIEIAHVSSDPSSARRQGLWKREFSEAEGALEDEEEVDAEDEYAKRGIPLNRQLGALGKRGIPMNRRLGALGKRGVPLNRRMGALGKRASIPLNRKLGAFGKRDSSGEYSE